MKFPRSFAFSAGAFFTLCSLAYAAKKDKLPPWLEDALELKTAYDRFSGENDGLVLHDYGRVEYLGKDQSKSLFRRAVHIRTRDARSFGSAIVSLSNKEAKLVGFRAWIVYQNGRVESFDKRDLVEFAEDMDALYSESKSLVLDRVASMRDDTVFAFEYELSAGGSFLEEAWLFQTTLPTLYSRFEVDVPEGWTVSGYLLNGVAAEFSRTGNASAWEARNLPSLKDEPSRPPEKSYYGMLGVSVMPDEKSISRYGLKVFKDWGQIARYAYDVQASQVEATPEIVAKAKALTSGSQSDWERVKAIGEYVQTVNYVAVNMHLSSGGGYTPRPASFVFEKHYGDCKDMVGLARAMLGSVGIDSYPVVASVGEEAYVHEQWPSPVQFNHCVLAVAASEELDVPAAFDHPKFGRLMIFDPTQKYTPVGQLPGSLQGTKILVGVPEEGPQELVELPIGDPQTNRISRSLELSLDESGTLTAKLREQAFGVPADFLRSLRRGLSPEEFRDYFKRWIAGGVREPVIASIEFDEQEDENSVILSISFSSPRYARRIGDSKMLFSPVFLTRMEWVPPVEDERTTDYLFGSWLFEEDTVFAFPDGYALESQRGATSKEGSGMSYEYRSELEEDGRLAVRRVLISKSERVPPDRYGEVVDFYEEITRHESAPVVLSR